MPGVRWGNDITDEAALRVENIDALERELSNPKIGKERQANLLKTLADVRAETKSVFGSERGARSLAKFATYDGGTVEAPNGVTYKSRPKLSKSAHRIAARAGATQGGNPLGTSSYNAGRTARTSARNPVGREGASPLRATSERLREQDAARRIDNAGRGMRADSRTGRVNTSNKKKPKTS
jgi:hypothetical protein